MSGITIPEKPDAARHRKLSGQVRQAAVKFLQVAESNWPEYPALILLRHLEPTAVTMAETAHRALIQDAIRRLKEGGYIQVELAPLLDSVLEFLEAHGKMYQKGQWMPDRLGGEWRWEDDHWHLYVGELRYERSPHGGWSPPIEKVTH